MSDPKCVTHFTGCACQEQRTKALEKVAEAARIASHEIQTQRVCWPAEVDDLADALKALDSEKGERRDD